MTDQSQRSRRFHAGRRQLPWGLTVLMATALAAAAPAQAADFVVSRVTDSGPGSLREAIEQANAMVEPCTITFSVSGRIELENALPPITGTLTIDGTGRSIVIDGMGAVRPFFIDGNLADPTLTVRRLTITNRRASGGGAADHGGAIFNAGGTLHVEHSVIVGRLLISSTVSGNTGGGIDNGRGLTILSNTIVANSTGGADATRLSASAFCQQA